MQKSLSFTCLQNIFLKSNVWSTNNSHVFRCIFTLCVVFVFAVRVSSSDRKMFQRNWHCKFVKLDMHKPISGKNGYTTQMTWSENDGTNFCKAFSENAIHLQLIVAWQHQQQLYRDMKKGCRERKKSNVHVLIWNGKKLVFTPNIFGSIISDCAHTHTHTHSQHKHEPAYTNPLRIVTEMVRVQVRVSMECIDYATLIKRFIFYEQTFNMHVSSFTTRLSQHHFMYCIIYQPAYRNTYRHIQKRLNVCIQKQSQLSLVLNRFMFHILPRIRIPFSLSKMHRNFEIFQRTFIFMRMDWVPECLSANSKKIFCVFARL